MPHDPPAVGRRRFSAEKVAVAEPMPQGDVSNADVLKALLAMSDGIRGIVAETVARHFANAGGQAGASAGPPANLAAEIGSMVRREIEAVRDSAAHAMAEAIRVTVAQAVETHMADVRTITQEVKDIEDASFRGLRKELSDMMAHIDKTKTEIAALRPHDSEDNQIVIATSELDAVVQATETATSEILEQSEKIQEIVQKLRDDCSANRQDNIALHIDDLEAVSTQLLMSCSFQDLTGQRINKVVNTLLYIEQHIGTMMTIWNIDRGTGEAHLMTHAPDDERPDKDLLNGPQLDGAGVSQDDIDALFG